MCQFPVRYAAFRDLLRCFLYSLNRCIKQGIRTLTQELVSLIFYRETTLRRHQTINLVITIIIIIIININNYYNSIFSILTYETRVGWMYTTENSTPQIQHTLNKHVFEKNNKSFSNIRSIFAARLFEARHLSGARLLTSVLRCCVCDATRPPTPPVNNDYNITHLLLFFFLTAKAALVAVSNTSLTPSLVLAEHSR